MILHRLFHCTGYYFIYLVVKIGRMRRLNDTFRFVYFDDFRFHTNDYYGLQIIIIIMVLKPISL